jgi:lipoprotein-anchoring transpeptidase ErfK/SrfK
VTGKGYSFGGDDRGYTCYYYTQFYGDYLFHTRLYSPYSDPYDDNNLVDGRMNQCVSQGCVRMYTEDARWLYDNIPYDTTVVCLE